MRRLLILKKKKKFYIFKNKNKYEYDIIIDASYEGSNKISNNIHKNTKFKYQLVFIFEFLSKNFNRLGLAVMDGKFFSFLPNGEKNKHIFYHVKHSVLYEKIHTKYPTEWKINKKLYKKIIYLENKILKDLKKYFPKIKIKKTGKKFISPRVLPINQEKTDRRVSSIKEISNPGASKVACSIYLKSVNNKASFCDISRKPELPENPDRYLLLYSLVMNIASNSLFTISFLRLLILSENLNIIFYFVFR